MKRHTLLASTIAVFAVSLAAPMARADCDISETKCAVNGGKCNIKFRNRTADTSGSSSGTYLSQDGSAQTVKVKALKENGNTAGNVLTINAGASNTMNLDNKAKKNFAKVRITSPAMARVDGVTMSCQDVIAVLDGNGTCKIFHGYPPYGDEHLDYQLGYSCDGGSVVGPTE
ncbi:MAG: hypothetical protein AAFY82_10610 [Pseudomonadota bacterium]